MSPVVPSHRGGAVGGRGCPEVLALQDRGELGNEGSIHRTTAAGPALDVNCQGTRELE